MLPDLHLHEERESHVQQAKKYNLKNHYSNYDSILTYDEHGYVDFQNVLDEYSEASEKATQEAGRLLVQNAQDMTARSGFALAGWNPGHDDMKAQAVEWWNWGTTIVQPLSRRH
jgi:polyamine oxidase